MNVILDFGGKGDSRKIEKRSIDNFADNKLKECFVRK